MICIVIAIIIVILTTAMDLPRLIKNKLKKEIWATSALLLIGVTLSITFGLNFDISSPLHIMKVVYAPVSDWFFNWLK